jgi:isocitrate dehydrogenase
MAIGADSGESLVRTAQAEHIIFADATDDTYTGTWIDMLEYQTLCVHVVLNDSGTVQVHGFSGTSAGAGTKPADATDGTQIGTDITTTSITSIVTALPRWIKTKVTAAGAALSVYGVARRASR